MQREENERNTGSLTVSVFTAGGALPLEGATVTVTDTEGNILRTATTDRSGRTPRLVLPSVRAEEALTPNPSVRPYSIYGIRITKDGYYTHENSGVPVFAGITSVQPAELIPFSLYGQDGARPDGNLFFSSAQTLDGEEN